MEIKKKSIALKKLKNASFQFGGEDIIVKPYITLSDRIVLTKAYLEALYSEGDFAENYIIAKEGLIIAILDLFTNIEILKGEDDLVDIDNIVGSGLWEKVKTRITNFEEFESDLFEIADKIWQDNMSVTNVVRDAIGKVLVLLEKIDVSDENIGNTVAQFQKQIESLQSTLDFGKRSEDG